MVLNISVSPIGDPLQALVELSLAIETATRKAPLEIAEGIAKRAKELAPEDTGFLKSSIYAESISDTEAVVKADAYYSGYVEYGTSKMSAQPYMRPAVDEYRVLGKGIIEDIVESIAPTAISVSGNSTVINDVNPLIGI